MAHAPAEMLILDTDHMSDLHRGKTTGEVLRGRLDTAGMSFATTIVSVEELMRGRLAQLSGVKSDNHLIIPYSRLQTLVSALAGWHIVPWDDRAAQTFAVLRTKRLGIGTMDLRIASIALANNATLLSRNLRDFGRVPDLKVADWLS